MRPLSLRLYRLATAALSPLAPALLRARAGRGKEDIERLSERQGRPGAARPPGTLIWLHGASVGESLSLLPLIAAIRTQRPELIQLVTSGTVTSAELMAARLPSGVIHQYAPIDTPGAVARFLAAWTPQLGVFVESEIWPNLILGAKGRGAKLALVSARLSEGSLQGWARRPAAAHALFTAFDQVLAQDEAAAAALAKLGARDDGRLNLKRLAAPPPVDPAVLKTLAAGADGRPVLLAASTHPGEDERVLEAFARLAAANALLVIAPRHPVRAHQIAALAAARGAPAGVRSRGDALGADRVYIADTLGELGLWFSLADAALIGGSLLPGPGGHNPVEAAQLGCPIITGPHIDNWQGIYADLIAADAATMAPDAPALAAAFAAAVKDPAAARAQAARAHAAVARDETALNTAVQGLLDLIP
jgi:3-deoxy-D-manno-octulosonic-acid transferase